MFRMFINKHSSTPRGRSPPNDFTVEFNKEARTDSGFFNCVSHTTIEYSVKSLRKSRDAPECTKANAYCATSIMASASKISLKSGLNFSTISSWSENQS